MKELKELSTNYAMERSNEFFSQVVAQAYADGYRQGYKDREEEIPVNIRDDKTEYVDLGLPSGTLWSNDYERIDGKRLYLPFANATSLDIPTKEQCQELLDLCEWVCNISQGSSHIIKSITCVGPNGNTVKFSLAGYIKSENVITDWNGLFFWTKSSLDIENTMAKKMTLHLHNRNEKGSFDTILRKEFGDVFMGYKLPIRLVKAK